MRHVLRALAVASAVVLCGIPTGVFAQAIGPDLTFSEHPLNPPLGVELRVGGALSGVEIADYTYAYIPVIETVHLENIDTLQIEALFTLPDYWDALRFIGSPRFEVGGLINLRGRESVAHAALTWQFPIFETPLFVELSGGVGIHNGAASAAPPLRSLGCPFGFHYSYGVGANVGRWSTVLQLQHISHFGFCGPNNMGINEIGVIVGYKF